MVRIKQIMRKRVVTVDPSRSVSDVARVLSNNRVGSAVVVKNRKPVGIITRDDILKVVACGKSISAVKVSDLKQGNFITAKPEDDLKKVVQLMVDNGVSRVPVLDKGKLIGILTEKDILASNPKMADLLAEKMKYRIKEVSDETRAINGTCEKCSDFSEDLRHTASGWYCETCRNDDEGIPEEEEF